MRSLCKGSGFSAAEQNLSGKSNSQTPNAPLPTSKYTPSTHKFPPTLSPFLMQLLHLPSFSSFRHFLCLFQSFYVILPSHSAKRQIGSNTSTFEPILILIYADFPLIVPFPSLECFCHQILSTNQAEDGDFIVLI